MCTCVWSMCRAALGAPGTCLWEEGRRQQAGVEEGGSRLAVCSGVFLGAFFATCMYSVTFSVCKVTHRLVHNRRKE